MTLGLIALATRPLTKSLPRVSAGAFAGLRRAEGARVADRLDAEPDQVEAAGDLQRGEGRRRRGDQRADAEGGKQRVVEASQRAAEAEGDALRAAARHADAQHHQVVGSGRERDEDGGGEERRDLRQREQGVHGGIVPQRVHCPRRPLRIPQCRAPSASSLPAAARRLGDRLSADVPLPSHAGIAGHPGRTSCAERSSRCCCASRCWRAARRAGRPLGGPGRDSRQRGPGRDRPGARRSRHLDRLDHHAGPRRQGAPLANLASMTPTLPSTSATGFAVRPMGRRPSRRI